MFGHDNHNDDNQDNNAPSSVVEPVADASLGVAGDDATTVTASPFPAEDPVPQSSTSNTPGEDMAAPAVPSEPAAPDSTEDLLPATASSSDDLISIKQQALQQLSPLVGHLNQTPEERFKTTMMMIQASDDQSLIQTAYDAAKEIPDEKTKAQALLDVVNEINYFTQQSKED